MFTGIIEEIGIIESIKHKKNLSRIKVRAKITPRGIKKGDSLSVDGVCLTVTDKGKNILLFDVMKETLQKTTLGKVLKSRKVNLERALKANSRLSGHFVTGHIDQIGSVKECIKKNNYIELQIVANTLKKYLVPKGSVCINGVSLTVGEVNKNYFSVYLIPFTDHMTNLGLKKKGDRVNIETDILAKYILNKN